MLVLTAALSMSAQGPGPSTFPMGWVLATSISLAVVIATLLLVRAVGRG